MGNEVGIKVLAAAYLVLGEIGVEPGYSEATDDAREGIAVVMVKLRREQAEREENGPLCEAAGLEVS